MIWSLTETSQFLNVDRKRNGAVTRKCFLSHNEINFFGRMKSVPKQILISVRARRFKGKTSDLSSVPSYPTTSLVQSGKPIDGLVSGDVLDHISSIEVNEFSIREILVEISDHCLDVCVERKNKLVNFFRAFTVGSLS